MHCTKISPEFEFGVKAQRPRSPGTKTKYGSLFGIRPMARGFRAAFLSGAVFGARLRRWQNHRMLSRISSFFVIRMLPLLMRNFVSAAVTLEYYCSTSIHTMFTLNEYFVDITGEAYSNYCDCCAVVSEDLDWGCVSEHGFDIMMACYNESVPANVIKNKDSCRQVMRLCSKCTHI